MSIRRLLSGAVMMTVIMVAVAWLSGWFGHKIRPDDTVAGTGHGQGSYRTVAVDLVSAPDVEWATGTVESTRRTTVAARILARINEVRVAAGDMVASGDVLVLLDDRDLEARVQQAQEALSSARATRELAKVELERTDDLVKRGVASLQRLDQASTALRVADAEMDRLTRALEEAQTNLSYTEIRAPAAGRVIDRLAEPGDTVAPGQALLRLYDPGSLRVEAPVRETLAVNLKVGDHLEIRLPAASETVTGEIHEIVPYAEPGSRTMLVRALLPVDQRLFAGMFARMAIPLGPKSSLMIPETAVQRIGQLEFVIVVSGDAATRRMITTGERFSDGTIEVLSGLKDGETVAVLTTP